MPELRLPGIATGLDTGAIVQQLMIVNSRRLTIMEKDLAATEGKRESVVELQAKLNALKAAALTLSDSSQLKSYDVATSDDEVITAEASANAFEGNHDVKIKQLATSDRWIHDGFANSTSYVGAGTFLFSYDFQEMQITTEATTTLDDLVGLINNDVDNPGVTASILEYDDGTGNDYHMVLSGRESGSDYQITMNSSNTEVWKAETELQRDTSAAAITTKIQDLDGFTGTMESGQFSDRIRVLGTKHDGSSVDYYFDVTKYTTIEDLITQVNKAFEGTAKAVYEDGIISFTDGACGTSSLSLTLTFVPGTGTPPSDAAITLPTISQSIVGGGTTADAANLLPGSFTEIQSAQDSKITVDGYPDNTVQTAEVQLLTSVTAPADGGIFRLSFRGEETGDLDINDSAADIQAALNALGSIAEVGGVIVSGTGPSSIASPLTITFDVDAGNVPEIMISTNTLTPTPGDHTMSTQTQGKDGWISRSTNTVDNVISGVTLHLHDNTYNGVDYDSISVNLTRDVESLKEKVDGLITAYNTAVMFIQEETKFDPSTKTRGIFASDYFVQAIWSQIKDPFISNANGFGDSDSFIHPNEIGIDLGIDGMLKLDSTEFNEAIVENYLGVLRLIGAVKTGSSNTSDIRFNDSGSATVAGDYNVKVIVDGAGVITSAKIWGIDEEEADARDATISGGMITGNTSMNPDTSRFLYPEANLQLNVDITKLGQTLTAIISVKQGFAGASYDASDEILDSEYGSVPITKKALDTSVENTNERIEREKTRLARIEERLIAKFARLERTLQMINSQMGALGMLG